MKKIHKHIIEIFRLSGYLKNEIDSMTKEDVKYYLRLIEGAKKCISHILETELIFNKHFFYEKEKKYILHIDALTEKEKSFLFNLYQKIEERKKEKNSRYQEVINILAYGEK